MSTGKTLRCSHCSCTLVWLEPPPEAVPDPTWMSVYLSFSLLWFANSISCSVYIPQSITPVTLRWFCRNLDLGWIGFLSPLFSTLAGSFMLNSLLGLVLEWCSNTRVHICSFIFSALWAWSPVWPKWFSTVCMMLHCRWQWKVLLQNWGISAQTHIIFGVLLYTICPQNCLRSASPLLYTLLFYCTFSIWKINTNL